MRHFPDVFRYMSKAEFVTFASFKSPVGMSHQLPTYIYTYTFPVCGQMPGGHRPRLRQLSQGEEPNCLGKCIFKKVHSLSPPPQVLQQ